MPRPPIARGGAVRLLQGRKKPEACDGVYARACISETRRGLLLLNRRIEEIKRRAH